MPPHIFKVSYDVVFEFWKYWKALSIFIIYVFLFEIVCLSASLSLSHTHTCTLSLNPPLSPLLTLSLFISLPHTISSSPPIHTHSLSLSHTPTHFLLTQDQLRRVFNITTTLEEISALMAHFDRNGSGVIHCQSFIAQVCPSVRVFYEFYDFIIHNIVCKVY